MFYNANLAIILKVARYIATFLLLNVKNFVKFSMRHDGITPRQ